MYLHAVSLNLCKENVNDSNIVVTGNTVIDALYMVVDKIKNDAQLSQSLNKVLATSGYDVSRLKGGKKLMLITGHRRENFCNGFISMCRAIKTLTERFFRCRFCLSDGTLPRMFVNRYMRYLVRILADWGICFLANRWNACRFST